jgi:hypothetical protein
MLDVLFLLLFLLLAWLGYRLLLRSLVLCVWAFLIGVCLLVLSEACQP